MKEFLDPQKIGNVLVEGIREYDTEELFVKDVESKSQDEKLDEKEWDILN
jgi:hypothetical protein